MDMDYLDEVLYASKLFKKLGQNNCNLKDFIFQLAILIIANICCSYL